MTMSYLIVITTFLLIFGKLSDIIGQKIIFTIGLAVFTVSSLLCSLSASMMQLIIFRAVQGLGASMIISNTTAIVTNAFPSDQRGSSLGIIGAVVSVGLMTGPFLGGIIVHYFGWHYIFLVNLPIGALGIFMAIKFLPSKEQGAPKKLFHFLDALLWIIIIFCLVGIFRVLSEPNLNIAYLLTVIALFIFFIAVFFIRQLKEEIPLFNPSFFRNNIFLYSLCSGFFVFVSMTGISFMLPFFFERSLGLSTFNTGNILVALPASTALMAPIAGYLSDKLGQRLISTIGLATSSIGIALMFFVHQGASILHIIINLAIFGFGIGMFSSPNNSALMGSVDYKDRGTASGVLSTMRNLGMVSGVGIVSLLFNSRLQNMQESDSIHYANAFTWALPFILGFMLIGIFFSASRRSVR